jgi:hypothetical protein
VEDFMRMRLASAWRNRGNGDFYLLAWGSVGIKGNLDHFYLIW